MSEAGITVGMPMGAGGLMKGASSPKLAGFLSGLLGSVPTVLDNANDIDEFVRDLWCLTMTDKSCCEGNTNKF